MERINMLSLDILNSLNSVLNITGPANWNTSNLIINTDSRNLKKGDTFVALRGENFDGFDYIEQVIEHGAAVIVYTAAIGRNEIINKIASSFPEVIFVEVFDTLKFIQELASKYIQIWRAKKAENKIISITGSNGKTTHKEMLTHLLSSVFPEKVLSTKGNLNNHIGVPLTIFRLEDFHDIAIIEMGMNHPGEISELCEIAHPEHGIITNIGAAHIEFMHSLENIYQEKLSLYKAVLRNSDGHGMFVVNADDKFLSNLAPSKGLTTYGEMNGDIKINIIDGKITFNFHDHHVLITNKNILEHHNLKNLAGTAIFAMKLFPDKWREIALAASLYQQPSMNRSQWVDNIFLDAYNANPSSMKASLSSFISIVKGKNIELNDCYFVLGDMNELGVFSQELHREIGQFLKNEGIKNVSFIGRFKDFYIEGFSDPISTHLKKEEFEAEWKIIRSSYKFIFVKASRSLQLESLMSIV